MARQRGCRAGDPRLRQFRKAVQARYLDTAEKQSAMHVTLAQYFHSQGYWRESLEDQRKRAKKLPPTPRPATRRKVEELVYQRLRASQIEELEDLLTDLFFLEAKTETGMVFELAIDFSNVVAALPEERPRRRILYLLEEAVRRDIHFITSHPTTFFNVSGTHLGGLIALKLQSITNCRRKVGRRMARPRSRLNQNFAVCLSRGVPPRNR